MGLKKRHAQMILAAASACLHSLLRIENQGPLGGRTCFRCLANTSPNFVIPVGKLHVVNRQHYVPLRCRVKARIRR